jgi:integrase/recombinase XerD
MVGRFQLHLIASCASICNRNRIATGVRVTQRHYELAAEVWHMKEPQKLPLVLARGAQACAHPGPEPEGALVENS